MSRRRKVYWTECWACPRCRTQVPSHNAAQSHISRFHRGDDYVKKAHLLHHQEHGVRIVGDQPGSARIVAEAIPEPARQRKRKVKVKVKVEVKVKVKVEGEARAHKLARLREDEAFHADLAAALRASALSLQTQERASRRVERVERSV